MTVPHRPIRSQATAHRGRRVFHTFEQYRAFYFPAAVERERRERLTPTERAIEDGKILAQELLAVVAKRLRRVPA